MRCREGWDEDVGKRPEADPAPSSQRPLPGLDPTWLTPAVTSGYGSGRLPAVPATPLAAVRRQELGRVWRAAQRSIGYLDDYQWRAAHQLSRNPRTRMESSGRV